MPRMHGVRGASSHVATLDGLRGIAIAGVLWYHAWLVSQVSSVVTLGPLRLDLQPFARAGFLGVDLFFFVSGFCLFYPYARHVHEGKAMPTWGDFATRRVEKILPSYLVALAAFAALHRPWFESTSQWLVHVGAHLSFLHPLWFDTFGSISGPLWTLGIEVQFYALFPIICWVFRRSPLLVFAGLCVVANLYRAVVAQAHVDTMLYATSQLPAVIDVFGSGMLAAYAISYAERWRSDKVIRVAATAATAGAALALFLLVQRVAVVAAVAGDSGQYVWMNAHRPFFALLFFVCGVGSTLAVPAWQRVLAQPLLVFLAAISYNLYLWHLEVIVWYEAHVAGLVRAVVHDAIVAGLIVPAFLCVLAAAIVTRVVERPFLRGGWRRFAAVVRRRSAPPPLPPGEGGLLTSACPSGSGLHGQAAFAAPVEHIR